MFNNTEKSETRFQTQFDLIILLSFSWICHSVLIRKRGNQWIYKPAKITSDILSVFITRIADDRSLLLILPAAQRERFKCETSSARRGADLRAQKYNTQINSHSGRRWTSANIDVYPLVTVCMGQWVCYTATMLRTSLYNISYRL